jgi:hypothetical protein
VRNYISMTIITLLCGLSISALAQNRAEPILNSSRDALGGETLKALNGLSFKAKTRHIMRDGKETSGEIEFHLQKPGKISLKETLSDGQGGEISHIESHDEKTSAHAAGGGVRMLSLKKDDERSDGKTPPVLAVAGGHSNDINLLMIGWLLKSPTNFAFEGEADTAEGKAFVINLKEQQAQLFIDQSSYRPLSITFKGKEPHAIILKDSSPDGSLPPAPDALPELEIQYKFSDYRSIDRLLFPHHLTKVIGGKVIEEWDIYEVKPTF